MAIAMTRRKEENLEKRRRRRRRRHAGRGHPLASHTHAHALLLFLLHVYAWKPRGRRGRDGGDVPLGYGGCCTPISLLSVTDAEGSLLLLNNAKP